MCDLAPTALRSLVERLREEGVASSVATAMMPGRTARRLLGAVLRLALVAGCAVVGYLLLSAGAAHADRGSAQAARSSSRVVEVAETAQPGKTVKAAVSRTRERVKTVRTDHPLKPVTTRLTKAVKPVLKPVSRIVEPVSKPLTRVLKPVVTRPVVTRPVVTKPPLRPVVTPPAPRPVRPARTAVVPDRHTPPKHVPAVSKPAAGPPPAARPPVGAREDAPAPTRCTRSAPANPQRGTSASSPGTAPRPWPQPGPAYLGLASSAAAAGADPAPRTLATTSAAWLCPPAPVATSTLDSVHRRGRRPTSAPPPG